MGKKRQEYQQETQVRLCNNEVNLALIAVGKDLGLQELESEIKIISDHIDHKDKKRSK